MSTNTRLYPRLIHLPQYIDSRGVLVFSECGGEIPFTINRVLWIMHAPKSCKRGGYAHKQCHQFIIPLAGSFDILINETTFHLNSSHIGLYIPPLNKITLSNFCKGTTALVLCSHKHSQLDIII